MRCRFCGSKALQQDSQRKNFSTGKAVAGAVTFGVVGAAAGFIGKDVSGYRCGACGQFMAEPMDASLEMQIDIAVSNAEMGIDSAMARYYQEQYPNVQVRYPAAAPQVERAPVERPVPAAPKMTEMVDPSAYEKAEAPIKRSYEPGVWQQGCPIFVDAVTLRTKDGEDQLSLSAVNLSEKTVRSAYFQAVVFDDTGDEITRKQCVYQNLAVPGGDASITKKCLPEDTTFPLGTDLAHRVDLVCEKVAFADDAVWRAPEAQETVVLPEQPILSAESFPRYRYLRSRLRDSDSAAPLRMPVEADGFWLCGCGHPAAKDAACPFCGDTLPALREAFSQKTLETLQLAAVKERAAKRAAFSQKAYDDALAAKIDGIYQKALKLEKKDTPKALREAIALFEQIPEHRDAQKRIEQAQKRIPELEAKAEAERKAAEEKAEAERKAAEEKAEAERAAAAAKKAKTKKTAIIIAAAVVLFFAVVQIVSNVIIPNGNYRKAAALLDAGDYDAAIEAFEAMDGYKDSAARIEEAQRLKVQEIEDAKRAELDQAIQEAEALEREGKTVEAAMAFGAIAEQDAAYWQRSRTLWDEIVTPCVLAGSFYESIALKSDGGVVAVGEQKTGQCDVDSWSGVVSVAVGYTFSIGLREDGTVFVAGNHADEIGGWNNLVAVSANHWTAAGLEADGTVIALGDLQEQVSDWTGIVAISAGDGYVVGLKQDGTVVAAGTNDDGECNVSDWTDIVAISAGMAHTLGLKSDGTVVVSGSSATGRAEVTDWTDIVAIAAGAYNSIGLQSNGMVVTAGKDVFGICDVSGWSNIVEIAIGSYHSLGLRSDGTVVSAGSSDYGKRNVSDWTDIRLPNR